MLNCSTNRLNRPFKKLRALRGRAANRLVGRSANKPITHSAKKSRARSVTGKYFLVQNPRDSAAPDLIGLITKHLKNGERVKIAGLGILQVRNRAARMGRNPMTGEPIQIKASKKVAFRATKELKMAI
jgi:DNA-binding protein HU-beta